MPTIFRDKVMCGTVLFNDPTAVPPEANSWGCDTLEGWKKSASRDIISTPFGGSVDGEINANYWPAKAKQLMAGGWATASSRANAEVLEDLILGDAFPANEDLTLVRWEGVPKFMRVRVLGEAEITNVGPNAFRWVVPLQASDPFKYSYLPLAGESGTSGVAGISSGGRTYPRQYPLQYTTLDDGSSNAVNIVNSGTAPTYPIAYLTGPLPKGGWRLANDTTNEFISFDVDLTATDTLQIDFAERIALLNGYPVTRTITGDFWRAKRGVNVIKLYAPYDPTASFTISINSAWR